MYSAMQWQLLLWRVGKKNWTAQRYGSNWKSSHDQARVSPLDGRFPRLRPIAEIGPPVRTKLRDVPRQRRGRQGARGRDAAAIDAGSYRAGFGIGPGSRPGTRLSELDQRASCEFLSWPSFMS